MNKWVHIDEKYLKILRQNEPRIPYSLYGDYKFKPFFGVLFEIDDLSYITQVSSPKPRHQAMNNQKDFKKIYDEKGNFLCVVNLNYMFPIPTVLLEYVKYQDIDKYVKFNNIQDKNKYIRLLKAELNAINKINLRQSALDLYYLKYSSPNDFIAKRCFDFKKLEIISHDILKSLTIAA